MTNEIQQKIYQWQHQQEMKGKKWAIFNPLNKELKDLPIIYGFNNGGNPNWYHAQLIAEDGTPLGSHLCSNECYMEHDLGILDGTRPDRHETFQKHYPEGYRMEFISSENVLSHQGLNDAVRLNNLKHQQIDEVK